MPSYFDLQELIALPDLIYGTTPRPLNRYNPFELVDTMALCLSDAAIGIDLDPIKTYVRGQLPGIGVSTPTEAALRAWELCDSQLPPRTDGKVLRMQKDTGIYKLIGSQHIGISFIEIGTMAGAIFRPEDRLLVEIETGPPRVTAYALLLQLIKRRP